ncbi:MAG: hypothetical protein MUO88_09555 [Desulfobacterales bacterium]|nr:hypothetical protein [Desulfobacterales bacterium]
MYRQCTIEKQSVFLADSDKILTGSVAILVRVREEAISDGPNGGKGGFFKSLAILVPGVRQVLRWGQNASGAGKG